MAAERKDADTAHELRLEGIGLLLGGGVLLALLVGSFLLGRWVERRAHPPRDFASAQPAGPLSQMVLEEPPAEAEEDLTHFDTVQGGETAPEPRREIPAVPPAESAPPASPPAAGGDATGKFFVQVGALRDRQAAAELVRALEARGYGVRLFSEREGTGTLYKVRVGGYASEPDARAAASALKAAGYPGAFVRPAD